MPVADIGPVHIKSEQEHHVSIPTVAGIVIVIAGLGLLVMGRRST
jgi:UDP-N-acetylmuramyl pentapeptide phosphotransferase/UDP-N-acetylglucosamine-1-phosphate transferase